MPPAGFGSPYFMLSYSHDDKKAVEGIEAKLMSLGLECFRDEKDIDYGENIPDRVRDAIQRSSHVLIYISPASIKSQWVLVELGAAWALKKTILCYLHHPSIEPPQVVRDLRNLRTHDQLEEYARRISSEVSQPLSLTPLEDFAWRSLYFFPGGHVRAVRLIGADDEYFGQDRVKLHYSHMPLRPNAYLAQQAVMQVEVKREEAASRGATFFNGPNTRLAQWSAAPVDGPGVALERKTMSLFLAPVGWYEYEGLNTWFQSNIRTIAEYQSYVGLSHIVRNGDVSKSELSNILDTATSVITNDGYIGYQVRGGKVSTGINSLTSAVAENINRYWDDATVENFGHLHNLERLPLQQLDSVDYVPKGIPHPFAAVLRGVEEELSPRLLDLIRPQSIKLTGLSFDLDSLHPDALFLLPLDVPAQKVMELCDRYPGKDYYEGKLEFTKADFFDTGTSRLLVGGTWIPGGQASVVRAIELLDAVRRSHHVDERGAFDILSN